MKLKFMTPTQVSKDQHRLREKIEKEKEEKIKLMEKEVEKQGLIEGYPCLVAFVYESDNNVVSQRLVEDL